MIIARTISAALALAAAASTPAIADRIAGTGALSGAVTAPGQFTAAKVMARRTGTNIMYMVFTENGQYSAVNVMPGTYDVWVETPGFSSDKQTVAVATDKSATANITLKAADVGPLYIGTRTTDRKVESFDQIYPPGRGRDILERSCFRCHGFNFLPAMPQHREAWGAAVDYMTTAPRWGIAGKAPFLSTAEFTAEDREVLLDYLAKNIGDGMPERVVGGDPEPPKDEKVLGKAMIIQYDFAATDALTNRVTQETAFDSKGNVWVTNVRKESALIKLDPTTGQYTDYPMPNKGWSPHGLIVDGDDTIWAATLSGGLVQFDPETGNYDAYGKTHRDSGGLSPFLDSKGNAYWTDIRINEIGMWKRADKSWKKFQSPSPVGSPYGLVVDGNDKMWYAEFHGCTIVRFDPETEKLTPFKSPSAPCAIRRPGADSKGNIWYGVWDKGRIEKLDPTTGKATVFQVPVKYAAPYDTWVAPDDTVWSSSDSYLIHLDPASGAFKYYPTPQRTDEPKITITRDGAVWYPPRGFASAGGAPASAAVLYPDKSKMTTFKAFYAPNDPNAIGWRYKGPRQKVAGISNDGGAPIRPMEEHNPDLGNAGD